MLRGLLNRLVRRTRLQAPYPPAPAGAGWEMADRLIADGNRAERAGNPHEACERYRSAVAVAPDYAKSYLNLAIGLEALGNADEAMRSYREALELEPADPYAAYNLGKMLYARASLVEAERLLRRALEARPEFPEANVVLASVLEARGDPAAAAVALEASIVQRPDYPGALYNYAAILKKLGRLGEAESALRRVTAIDAENPQASYDLATLLVARGALKEAEDALRTALRRKPDFADARRVLFHVCESLGNLPGATAELEALLEQQPAWVDALYNYGRLLRQQMRLAESESVLRRVIAIDPRYVLAYRMLGGVLLAECRIEEALELYRVGRQRCDGDLGLESSELFVLNCSEGTGDEEFFARHAAFGARLETTVAARFAPFANTREAERRLRIGYLSPNFCFHVVTLFMIPLIERHDRAACEVYCYSTGGRTDDFTKRISSRADVWRELPDVPDSALADAINRDGIDILVDLGGHAGIAQLGVFAQQPAPVQATWLGYLNTTGLTRIQYRLSDRTSDPPGLTEHLHTETLLRLPNSQWCYRPLLRIGCAPAPPCKRHGFTTFGSFNQAMKLSPTVRSLWASILLRLPDSRLVIVGVQPGRATDGLLRDFSGAGVDPARLTILPYVPLEEYYRCFNEVDIALDTMPYSGGTTTCDALWMGVPVLTLPGSRPSSRSAASLLTSAGLGDWIAANADEYLAMAVAFARDQSRLADLRRSLRERMRRSPLMDEAQFARDIEDAYRRMWRTWCESAGS